LATACCGLFAVAAFIAILINHHSVLPFYFGFGFLAIVLIVWFRGRRRPNT
jgi:Flp pilus assembly protein TadB